MKAAGIITEYNPFHQGHEYHLAKTREVSGADVIICILSGCFSQRGLPSVLSLQDKADLAIAHGADLVLQLPAIFAAQSADYFARYALQSLSVLGVDEIIFGSETEDLALLEDDTMLPKDPSQSLARRQQALSPNDILGRQYIRWCRQLGIGYRTIRRNENFISATQSRKNYFAGQPVDHEALFQPLQRWESYYPYLRFCLLMSDPADLSQLFLVNEGIENRLIRCAREHESWSGFLEAAISKTYSRARIQRTCLMILLQVKKEFMARHDSFFYALPVAFNDKGRAWLGSHRSSAICMKYAQMPDWLKTSLIKEKTLYSIIKEKT